MPDRPDRAERWVVAFLAVLVSGLLGIYVTRCASDAETVGPPAWPDTGGGGTGNCRLHPSGADPEPPAT